MRYDKRHNAGFTLLETIAILVILAIISAVAISRVGFNESDLRAEVNDLKTALRYAQQMAIASDSTMTFTINVTTTGYTISASSTGGGTVSQPSLPGESSSSHSFTGVSGAAATFIFNEWGGLTTASETSVQLQLSGGGGSKTINVISETGYAYES